MSFLKNFLVIIPARKGSKRLLNKNIRKISGKSLSEITISFACKIFPKENIIFTSNDNRLLNNRSIRSYGINILKRKEVLSTSRADINDVIFEILNFHNSKQFQHIILLQPTSPVRSVHKFKKIIEYYINYKKNNLISAKLLKRKLDDIKKKNILTFSKKYYIPSGNFYISSIKLFKKKKSFFHKDTNIYEISNYYHNIDIDFLKDFQIAKKFLEK